MKTTLISTASLTSATRLSLMKAQLKLAEAQKEVTTGRHADVGASLGYKTGQTLSLRQDHARLTTIIDTNSVVSTRLSATQASLKSLSDDAQLFVSQLIGARNTDSGPTVVQNQAKAALVSFTNSINTAVDGAHLFAGINADVRPLTDYFATPTAANRQAVADAFLANFGTTADDPANANISAADMQAFLDGPFSDLFADPAWTTSWSAASDQNVKSRISTSELIETSTNANNVGMRKLAMAYAMVADLGIENLNEAAYQAVVDTATRAAGAAVQDLAKEQSRLGTSEERVKNANAMMSIQIDIMTNHISLLEGVDPYEASTRVSALMTQVETAYAMTARIQNLSLLRYLPPG
ncbi:MAG: flagellar hook-associated family protein [Sphingomonadales bacterium]|nr:flagellar hook-associated family protein [Sphingomonadales bacterium]